MTAKDVQDVPQPGEAAEGAQTIKSDQRVYTQEELDQLLKSQYDKGKTDKGREYKAEQEAAEKKREEEEAIQRGEFEKVLKEREAKIEALSSQNEKMSQFVTAVQEREQQEVQSMLSDFSAEKRTELEGLIDGLPTDKAKSVIALAKQTKPVTTPKPGAINKKVENGNTDILSRYNSRNIYGGKN